MGERERVCVRVCVRERQMRPTDRARETGRERERVCVWVGGRKRERVGDPAGWLAAEAARRLADTGYDRAAHNPLIT